MGLAAGAERVSVPTPLLQQRVPLAPSRCTKPFGWGSRRAPHHLPPEPAPPGLQQQQENPREDGGARPRAAAARPGAAAEPCSGVSLPCGERTSAGEPGAGGHGTGGLRGAPGGTGTAAAMDWAGESTQLAAIVESEGSEEEEEEEEKDEEEDEEEEEEEAAMVQTLSEDDEARAWLDDFQQASQALLAELSALEAECEIQRTCRQQAEAYAAQVQKENTKLKRLSLALPPGTGAGDVAGEGDPSPDPTQEELKGLQEKLSWLLVEKKEASRQSSILLQSAAPSAQLLRALQEVGSLSRALEEARQQHQQQVKELEEQLRARPRQEELELARAALAAAEEGRQELRAQLQEARGRLEELEAAASLEQEGDLARSEPPPPPPPPPLPPPAPSVPVDPLLALRQRKGQANPQHRKPGPGDAKARAVQEMMERIKNGVVLRPAKERVALSQSASKRRSAALELRGILGAMRRASRRTSGRRSSVRGQDRQLEAILQRRRRAIDVPESPPGPDTTDPDPNPDPDPGAGGRTEPGHEDAGRAASPSPWHGDGAGDPLQFRPRAVGGISRSRPCAWQAGGGEKEGRGQPQTHPKPARSGADGGEQGCPSVQPSVRPA
nr:shootin-1-like isoform X2 [Anas platyrhynchos]